MRSVIPWSWTMLEAYETCPRAFYEIRLAKNFKDDGNAEYLLWGNSVHTGLQMAVDHGKPLPDSMKQWAPIANTFRAAKQTADVYCEVETAVTVDLQACGYWDANCYNRGKEDVLVVKGAKALVTDYKTGKPKRNATDQLRLSAGRIFVNFPEVQVVQSAYAWLQDGTWTRAEYRRSDLNAIWDGFKERMNDMLWSEKNNTWPAKPSGLCKRSKKPGSTYGGCIVATCPHSEYYRGGR